MSLQNLFVQDSGKSSQDVYCDELVCNSQSVAENVTYSQRIQGGVTSGGGATFTDVVPLYQIILASGFTLLTTGTTVLNINLPSFDFQDVVVVQRDATTASNPVDTSRVLISSVQSSGVLQLTLQNDTAGTLTLGDLKINIVVYRVQ